jgi:hypothetical protein
MEGGRGREREKEKGREGKGREEGTYRFVFLKIHIETYYMSTYAQMNS